MDDIDRTLVAVEKTQDWISTLQSRIAKLEQDNEYLHGFVETLKNRIEKLEIGVERANMPS